MRDTIFNIAVGEFKISCQSDGMPTLISEYQQHAELVEEFEGTDEFDTTPCFIGVAKRQSWPFLIVKQHYCSHGGFNPGALLIPNAKTIFLGAGTRLLAYDLEEPNRLWEDYANGGFWSWSHFGDIVLMAAELELVAWNAQGDKLWSHYVEPPWDFNVTSDTIDLDVMGTRSQINLHSGR